MWKLPILEAQLPSTREADTAIVAVFQDSKGKPLPPLSQYRECMDRLKKAGAFDGKRGALHFIRFADTERVENLLFMGMGPAEELSPEKTRVLGGLVWAKLKAEKVKVATIAIEALPIRAFAEGFILSAYRFEKYKSNIKEKTEAYAGPSRLGFVVGDKKTQLALALELRHVEAIAESVRITRDWSNEPSNHGTPEYFAAEAKKWARSYGLKYRELTPRELKREKMGLLLGVSQGSEREPRLVILEYLPKKAKKIGKRAQKQKKIALVGKGVTFDSGGISIKPSARMEDMKHDMTGAATVMGAMLLAARWGSPHHLFGVMVFTENMPDGNAIQPGNILTARNGKTVEVINTDAEGRLILADALDYIQDEKPDAIVDVATLTGAVSIALGKQCCAVLGNDDELMQSLQRAGELNGERIWQLPLYDEYFEDLKSDDADMKNSANDAYGGTIRGAIFLKQYIRKGTRWAHLDIASTAYNMGHLSYFPKRGASGAYVRTLARFVMDF